MMKYTIRWTDYAKKDRKAEAVFSESSEAWRWIWMNFPASAEVTVEPIT